MKKKDWEVIAAQTALKAITQTKHYANFSGTIYENIKTVRENTIRECIKLILKDKVKVNPRDEFSQWDEAHNITCEHFANIIKNLK